MIKSEFLWIRHDGAPESLDSFESATGKLGEPGYVWFNFVKASRDELTGLSGPLGLIPCHWRTAQTRHRCQKWMSSPITLSSSLMR